MSSRYDDLARPPLDETALSLALVRPGSRWTQVSVVASVESTNADLVRSASTDRRDGLVLIAEHQTAGRGRLDRTWVAPPRSGVTMSALVRPDAVPAGRWPWIPLLAGLAVAAAVQTVCGTAAQLKWPNDVVVDGRKLAGLLVQRADATNDGAGPAAVIGIGINVSTTRAELPVPQATSLLLEGSSTTDRATIIKAVLRRLDGLLAEWERGLGVPSRELMLAYRSACSTLGEEVVVAVPGQEAVRGRAADVDDGGRLVVETSDGTRVLGAGDVVHVRTRT